MRESEDRNCDFLRLYMRHEAKIRGYILCMVNNWTDTDDILQEAVLVMMKKFRGFDSTQRFLAWALRVAHFEVLNHFNRRDNRLPVFSPEVLEAIAERATREVEVQDARCEALQTCLDKLRERDREVLHLRYEVDATTASVAETLGRSVDAIYKVLNRVHHQLLMCVRRTLAQENHP